MLPFSPLSSCPLKCQCKGHVDSYQEQQAESHWKLLRMHTNGILHIAVLCPLWHKFLSSMLVSAGQHQICIVICGIVWIFNYRCNRHRIGFIFCHNTCSLPKIYVVIETCVGALLSLNQLMSPLMP